MGTQFSWFFDIALIAVLIGCFFVGIRKGFLSIMLGLLALAVAFSVALFASDGIAYAVYDNIISKAITEEIRNQVDSLTGNGLLSQIKSVNMNMARINGRLLSDMEIQHDNVGKISLDLSKLDLTDTGIENVDFSSLGVNEEEENNSVNLGIVEYSANDAEKYGIDTLIFASVLSEKVTNSTSIGTFTKIINDFTSSLPFFVSGMVNNSEPGEASAIEKIFASVIASTETDNITHRIADDIVKPYLLVPIRALIFVAIFVIIFVVLKLLSNLIRWVNKIPLIGGINKFLGAIAGIAQGAVVIFLICIFVQVIITLTGNDLIFLNTMTIDETSIFRHIYYFDFLDFMA